MGNKSTVLQCFETLSIPEYSRTAFKRKVLDYVKEYSPRGNDLTTVAPEDVEKITKHYIQSEQFRKFQYEKRTAQDLITQKSERELHQSLLELVNIWLDEARKQESQEDPSYSLGSTMSSTTPKKRKRQTDQSSRTENSKGKAAKKSIVKDCYLSSTSNSSNPPVSISTHTKSSEMDTHPPRSATIQSGSAPWEDTEQYSLQDSDDDSNSLPHVQQIINDRSGRKANTVAELTGNLVSASESQKGKAPVRHAVSHQRSSTGTLDPHPGVNDPGTSDEILLGNPRSDSLNLQDMSSQTAETPAQASSLPRHHRSMTSIEQCEGQQSDDTSLSITSSTSYTIPNKQQALNTHTSANARFTPEPTSNMPTPPPTIRRPLAGDTVTSDPVTPTPNPPTSKSRTHHDRYYDLVDSIQTYIKRCQEHSTSMAESSTSERERQRYQHRAVAFAELEGDIQSRINSFMAKENGVENTGIVRSVCLWS